MPGKPRLSIRIGSPLPVSAIMRAVPEVSEHEVEARLKAAIVYHFGTFGHEPFTFLYSRDLGGYAIEAGPIVGLIDCGYFELQIEPKFAGLEIGKCLQIAHRCQSNWLVKHTNNIVEAKVSDGAKLSGPDYFASAFVSAVIDVINNRLLRARSSVEGPDEHLRGTLVPDRHVSKGGFPQAPITSRPTTTTDIPANRTIKAALDLCRAYGASPDVKGLSSFCLSHFSEVSSPEPGDPLEYQHESSVPRLDYDRALALARIMIEGFGPTPGSEESFLPYFTLNLDELFESFVEIELKRMLSPDYFRLSVQKEYPHPLRPPLAEKRFKPDIVVQALSGGKASVVADAKNKYSLLDDGATIKLSNQDLFQIAYYSLALESNAAVLVFPGNDVSRTRYPLKGSEGAEEYERKRERAVSRIKSNSASHSRLTLRGSHLDIFFWRVNLQGTMQDTLRSAAELSLFLADAARGRI